MSRLSIATRRPMTRALLVVLVLAGAAGVAGTALPAHGDPYAMGKPDAGYLPDDTNQTYCFARGNVPWTSAWRSIVDGRMRNLDAQTNLTVSRQLWCDSRTDVWFKLDTTSSARGEYQCDIFVDAARTTCERGTIILNPDYLPDDANRRKTACHEIGHSVGLQHFPAEVREDPEGYWNDCMYSGPPVTGPQYEVYNAHHVAHINSRRVSPR